MRTPTFWVIKKKKYICIEFIDTVPKAVPLLPMTPPNPASLGGPTGFGDRGVGIVFSGLWGDQDQVEWVREVITQSPHTSVPPPIARLAAHPHTTPRHATYAASTLPRASASLSGSRASYARPPRTLWQRTGDPSLPTAPQGQTKTTGARGTQSTPTVGDPRPPESKRTNHGLPEWRSQPVRRPARAALGVCFLFFVF